MKGMVVVSTLKTANYGVKEKLHREKSAGGELIEFVWKLFRVVDNKNWVFYEWLERGQQAGGWALARW